MTLTDAQLPTPIGCEHRPDIRCMDCYLRDTSPQNRQKHAQLNHAAREAAIEEWRGHARRAVMDLARQAPDFTTDDVWALLSHWRIADPPDRRLMGPLLLRLQREGQIEPAGREVIVSGFRLTIYQRKRS